MSVLRLNRALSSIVAATTVSLVACLPGLAAAQQANAETTARLDEVVVTARKEAEPIQSVPISIQVFQPTELAKAGQRGLVDIAALTPGFVFQTYADSFTSSPTIRGLSQFDVTSSIANVSTIVDGVYLPRNYSVDLNVTDVSRVEIDKGPQSALYGSNAFAGVVSYTLAPPPKEAQAEASVTGGNAGRLDYKVAVGDSFLDDAVAARLNYARTEYDGTWRNYYPANAAGKVYKLGAFDNDTYGITVRIKPLSRLEVDLDYFRLNRAENLRPDYNVSTPPNATNPPYLFSNLVGDPFVKYNCGAFLCGTLSTNPFTYATANSTHPNGLAQPFQPGFTSRTDFYSARINYDITDELRLHYTYGWVSSWATSISVSADNALVGYTAPLAYAFGLGGLDAVAKEGGVNKTGSHELRLDWGHGAWKAIVGAYVANDSDYYQFSGNYVPSGPNAAVWGNPTDPYDFSGFPSGTEGQIIKTGSKAEFARLSYDFLDARANVSGEVRHQQDDLTSIASSTGSLEGATAAQISTRTSTLSYTTPKFTASYKIVPDSMLYLSVAQGVKEGGYNPPVDGGKPVPPDQTVFQPEKNWTYEFGSKNTFLDGRAIINADIFLVKWSDLQVAQKPSNAASITTGTITVNQGNATSKGFESDGRFAATKNLTLQYAFAYVDSTFDNGDFTGRFAGLCDGVICPLPVSVNGQLEVPIGGKTLPRYSKIQATAGATWKQAINADYSWNAHGEVTYQSQQQVEEMNLAQIPARTLVNLSAGITADHWDVTLWGRNVFNRHYVADSFFFTLPFAGYAGYSASMGELATFGVTFNAHLR